MNHTVQLLHVYLILNGGVSHGTQPIDACGENDPLYVTFHYGKIGRTTEGYDPHTIICTKEELSEAYKAYDLSKGQHKPCMAPSVAKVLGNL